MILQNQVVTITGAGRVLLFCRAVLIHMIGRNEGKIINIPTIG